MKDFLSFMKKGIKNVAYKIYLSLEDKPQTLNNTDDIGDLEDIKKRLNELEKDIEQLKQLSQTVTDMQTQVEKLPTIISNLKMQQIAIQKLQQPIKKNILQPEKPTEPTEPTRETHYVKQMETNGNIEIRNKIAQDEAYFELITFGYKAELRPLSEQSSYLIMQQKYLLDPAFTVSGSGPQIYTDKAAQYELRNNVWCVGMKGKVELR
jgi:TolA-binding protein